MFLPKEYGSLKFKYPWWLNILFKGSHHVAHHTSDSKGLQVDELFSFGAHQQTTKMEVVEDGGIGAMKILRMQKWKNDKPMGNDSTH
jgi:hypothetical protein